MRTALALILPAWTGLGALAQEQHAGPGAQCSFTEEIGLPMNKAQVMHAAKEAWQYSFGLEPGHALLGTDEENGVIEGTARVNYRSRLMSLREETLGSVTYAVSIQAKNGACVVQVSNMRHNGNRNAAGGGLDLGTLFEGKAPTEHYPGIGLAQSQRMHADVREVAGERVREVMRLFAARLRLLGEQ